MDAPPLDLDRVRARFPALATTDWALLDAAGGSVPLGAVIERIAEHMRGRPVQLGGSYPLSVEAADAVAAGRAAVARLLGGAADEVVLGPSATVLLRRAAAALRPLWREGDEVVVTDLDHEANAGPWDALAETGITVRTWRARPERAELVLEDLEPLLGPRTRLVAFPHVANVVGAIHDAAAIARRVRAAGALACVDGVAFAPHRRVDVRALGADLYVASLYKVFGPHLGCLWGRRELLLQMRGQSHAHLGEDRVPAKLEPGGVQHELVASLPAIVEHLEALGGPADGEEGDDPLARAFARVARHEAELVRPLLAFLRERRGVRLVGPADADPAARVATVAFAVDGLAASELPPRLEPHRVGVRHGDFHAPRAVRALGLEERGGLVRASFAHYHAPAEVERLVEALDAALP